MVNIHVVQAVLTWGSPPASPGAHTVNMMVGGGVTLCNLMVCVCVWGGGGCSDWSPAIWCQCYATPARPPPKYLGHTSPLKDGW